MLNLGKMPTAPLRSQQLSIRLLGCLEAALSISHNDEQLGRLPLRSGKKIIDCPRNLPECLGSVYRASVYHFFQVLRQEKFGNAPTHSHRGRYMWML